jgi:hypothetical protein
LDPCTGFTRAPPTRFRDPASRPGFAGASEFRSVPTSPCREPANRPSGRTTLTGSSHRNTPVSYERDAVRAIGFTLRRAVHCCRQPTLLGRWHRSTGVARGCSEVPSSRPSEFSVGLLAARRRRLTVVLSEFAPRSEFQPGEVPRYWFSDPTLPLAFPSALWFSFTGPRRAPLSVQCALSTSSAFLQSLAQLNLADQPQPISSSHGLRFPTALEDSEVHLPRALP